MIKLYFTYYKLVYITIIIYLYFAQKSNIIAFKCKTTLLNTNISHKSYKIVKKIHLYSKSYSNFITLLSENKCIKQLISNIDDESYSLLLIRDVYITERVIIHKCKILLFGGQCNYKRWYINSIKYKEIINKINYGFIITNWHGDGVFHGTVEGLTRIVPYIDYLLKNSYIYIIIPFPRYKQNTALHILKLIGFSEYRILYGKLFVRKLYIPTPYYCVESSTPLIIKFNKLLRSKMTEKQCKVSNMKFILIVQRSKNRIFKNMNDLINALLNNFNYTIITYYDNNSNLNTIYCWFTYAKIIIAFHGSGLTNIYFSQQSTIVVELSPTFSIYAFAKLGSQIGLKYYIYNLPINKLYTKYITFNISLFVANLKEFKIF